MASPDSFPSLTAVLEGKGLRVTTPQGSSLFKAQDPAAFLAILRRAFEAVAFAEGQAARQGRSLAFPEPQRTALRLDVALHWIRSFQAMGRPVEITAAELRHPQTWGLVLRAAEALHGAGSPDALALAAHTLSMAAADLAQWRRVEAERIARM